MSLKARRILFILFIIAFLIITPLVISYAVGYKISLSGKILQKTGMLILDTEPEGAKIYLNGKPRQLFFKKYFKDEESYITTPAKIKNLLPGKYDVKLELDGYYGWQKKLEIKPGMSTFAEDINLFKKNLPLLIRNGEIKQASLSPNGKYLAAVSDKEIDLIDLDNEKKIKLGALDAPEPSSDSRPVSWSPDNKKILFNGIVYNIDNLSKKLNLNNYIKNGIIKPKWRGKNEIIYLSGDKSDVKSFNLSDNTVKILIKDGKILDFINKNDNIFIVTRLGKSISLDVYKIGAPDKVRSIELPSFSDYEFINYKRDIINLYDKKHQILYLINPFSRFPLVETINNVKRARWVGKNKLLYSNDFEIWLADFNPGYSGKKTLLTRISNPINEIFWHPSENYVIYLTDNAIYAIELDDRQKRNITKLVKLDRIAFPFLGKNGKKLYFYAKIGNQKGLYKLYIQ